MKRRELIALLGGTAAAWPLAASAQEAGRIYRLGLMLPFPRDARESVGIVDALTDELRRNGFVERQNLAIEYRAWAPQMDLVSDYAADLAARPLDVFAVGGNTTGVSILATELNGKRQEILIEGVPGVRRIAAVRLLCARCKRPPKSCRSSPLPTT